MAVSTLFLTTASTETLNCTILGVPCFRGAKQKLHQKSYLLVKQTQCEFSLHTRTKQKFPYNQIKLR